MSQFKQFWSFIKTNHNGHITMGLTQERLMRAVYRRAQNARGHATWTDIEERDDLLKILELIGMGESRFARDVHSQLRVEAEQFFEDTPDEMFSSQGEQEEMHESIKAAGVALENIDTLPDIILNADSVEEAAIALTNQFKLPPNQALCLVTLGDDDAGAEGEKSQFTKEMQDLFNYAIWDLKTKRRDSEQAHTLTMEAIENIDVYLQHNSDADAASILAAFHYQAACDFKSKESPRAALKHFQKSRDSYRMSYEISMTHKALYQLAMSYFFLGQCYDEFGPLQKSVAQYSISHRILEHLHSSSSYQDSVSDDMYLVEDCLEKSRGQESQDEPEGQAIRKSFLFQYEKIIVWKNDERIVDSDARGIIEAVLSGELLNVYFQETLVGDYLLDEFEFEDISADIDRTVWRKDMSEPTSVNGLGVPTSMSLSYEDELLTIISLSVERPNVLIEIIGREEQQQATSEESIDLTNFFFMSSDHIRYQEGQQVSGHNLGCYRGISVSKMDNEDGLYSVAILKQDSPHPVWNDNYTMVPKIMEIVEQSNDKIVFRGVGFDDYGSPYGDYGITIELKDGEAARVVLHMLDRGANIFYMA